MILNNIPFVYYVYLHFFFIAFVKKLILLNKLSGVPFKFFIRRYKRFMMPIPLLPPGKLLSKKLLYFY